MKRSFGILFIALVCFILSPMTTFAGDINSAEQLIIDAISGTYEYEGAKYKVTDEYVSKVISYLNQDGIDMTRVQARGYIEQFNANIAVGISSGYMVKVEDAGGAEQPPEEQPEEPDTEPGDGTDEGDIDKDDSDKDDNDKDDKDKDDKDNKIEIEKDKNTGIGDSSKGSNSGNKGNGNSTMGEDKGTTGSSMAGSNTSNGNSTVGGNKGTGNSPTAGDNTGAGNGITAGDLGIGMQDGNLLSGFFSQPESGTETGVIEDNTIGSTTDGEIEYTVFPIDRTTMYVWDIDTLDVHTDAYKDSDVIGTLNKGDAVTIIGAATTGWAQIDYNGETGYVSAVYLRTQTYMSTVEESEITDNKADSKDYSDAAPLKRSFNLGTIAIVIVIVCIIGSGIIIIWHRNKSRKR